MTTDRSRAVRWILTAFLALALTSPVRAAVFTVKSSADSGAETLRDAIMQSNGVPGIDTINFAIPGDEVHTIQLVSPLPQIFEGVLIDGYSQPGASPNMNPPGQGFNTVLMIEVRGPGAAPCFVYRAGSGHVLGLGIQGLVINRCSIGIWVMSEADHLQISGNFIGTDPSGTVRPNPHVGVGIEVDGASSVDILSNLVSGADGSGIDLNGPSFATVAGNLVGTNAAGNAAIPNGRGVTGGGTNITVGGASPDSRNVVSGNALDGMRTVDGPTILGNFIGTDVTGVRPLGNSGDGISADGLATVIGNVIGANEVGLRAHGVASVIQGNFIGTDSTATLDLGNRSHGILAETDSLVVGGLGTGEGNVVAHNRGNGVTVSGPRTSVRGNRIYDNRLLGIDLSYASTGDGVTPNDPGDADKDINGLTYQNFPLITSVVPGTSTTHIAGTLNSMTSQTYDIDLYASLACPRRPHDYLQGETYLGSFQVTTDGFGNAPFAVDVPVILADGQPVTATATDAQANTSEFSQRIIFSVAPPAGPGGASVTLSGMEFEPGATVTVGGVPASNVVPIDPQTITATMPGFSPGTLHTVTVTDPSGLTGTLSSGWLADFSDVPTSHIFHDYVARLVVNGVSVGVGGGNYGVDQSTLRDQMAVFLLRGKHGTCYTPPLCTGAFTDVPCPATPQFPYSDWIEELFAEGITAGCGGGNYCPAASVTRAEMAVFLLKSEHGAGYAPPSCTGLFADVQCPATLQFPYSDWVEQLHTEGITAGCHINPLRYCPDDSNTRGQMAVFIVKTFGLP